MGAEAQCPRCGQQVTVDDPSRAWTCPTCGHRVGEKAWQRIGSGIFGAALVVTGVVILGTMFAVLASCS